TLTFAGGTLADNGTVNGNPTNPALSNAVNVTTTTPNFGNSSANSLFLNGAVTLSAAGQGNTTPTVNNNENVTFGGTSSVGFPSYNSLTTTNFTKQGTGALTLGSSGSYSFNIVPGNTNDFGDSTLAVNGGTLAITNGTITMNGTTPARTILALG